jgi:hypothetical protein
MRDAAIVRTTLDIADDVLQAAKELASLRGVSAGQMLSELARKGLAGGNGQSARLRNGVPLLASRAPSSARPTMRLVNHLRDDVS